MNTFDKKVSCVTSWAGLT